MNMQTHTRKANEKRNECERIRHWDDGLERMDDGGENK